jgi:trehalose transport system permease protein
MKRTPWAIYVASAVLCLYFLYPIWILFLVSFTPISKTIFAKYPSNLPSQFTLANLQAGLHSTELLAPFFRSLEIAFVVAALAILIGIPTAYGLSRLRPVVAYSATTLLFVVNMVPSLVIAIPLATDFIKVGLYDTVLGVALVQELLVIPLVVFLLVGAFQAIPRELEFQARVDGMSLLGTLFTVLVPLARAAIIASFLLAWMFSWDDFTFPLLLSPINPTLQVVIYSLYTRGVLQDVAAFSLLASVPVIILTIFLQRFLKGELLAGGLKG